jgi:hypothetical protein
MVEVAGPGFIRQIEEQILRQTTGGNYSDLSHLVAIFTRKDKSSWLPVFNLDERMTLPGLPEPVLLKQLIEHWHDILAEYDGVVIAFDALRLVVPDLITRGFYFYPMEIFYGKIHRPALLAQTQWQLAKTLFSALLRSGALQEKPEALAAVAWLKKTSKLFKLTLPTLLEQHPIAGLLAIVPDERFSQYLETLRCSLIYVAPDGLHAGNDSQYDLDYFSGVTTDSQLCAAFPEVALFSEGEDIHPFAPGFVDLRKELRASLYASDPTCIRQRSEDIKATIRDIVLCRNQLPQADQVMERLKTLEMEYCLADEELDDLVSVELANNISFASQRNYYLTLSESFPKENATLPENLATINDALRSVLDFGTHHSIATLQSLRQLFASNNVRWLSLSDVLLKLNRPQTLARSTYLTSRWLSGRGDSRISREDILNDAALSCYVYSLTEPYYLFWPTGDHQHHLRQSYKNFHEQLARYQPQKHYHRALATWWDIQEHDFIQRKAMLEEVVKELDSIKSSEGVEQDSALTQFSKLFSVLLLMCTSAWQPMEVRERLLDAGFGQIAGESLIDSWYGLDLEADLKLPSQLFLMELREFLTLSEKSLMIRIGEGGSSGKARQLIEIGTTLCQRVGLNFEKYRIEPGKSSPQMNDSFLLPEHERIWMRCLYLSAIINHAVLIHTLESKPVESKVSPREVTQYVSTNVSIALTKKTEERVEHEPEIEVVLLSSKEYDIQERIARRNVLASQSVDFAVAFRTKGYIALLFEYIVDKTQHYFDEAWVHVIDLKPQVRWIDNPYQYGTQITNPKNYYGRREELMMVLNHLRRRSLSRIHERQNFRLRGTRRSGKTSLLMMIRQTIQDSQTRRFYDIPETVDTALNKWHPIFYTFQGLSHEEGNKTFLDAKGFFMALTEEMCHALGWTGQATSAILSHLDADLSRPGDLAVKVEAHLEHIQQELGPDEYILVLLDEVDLLGSEKDNRIFGQLRTVITSPDLTQITWILTSNRTLQAPDEGTESPLHNVLQAVLLRNLDIAEARRLILEPAVGVGIYFEPEAVYRLLHQTGCQPFMLQVICSALVDRLNNGETPYISQSLVDNTIEQLLEPGTAIHDQCQLIWTCAGDVWGSRELLLLLAQHERGMNLDKLSSHFLQMTPTFSEEEAFARFSEAWEDLFANDLISQDSQRVCHLKIPLFRDWLQRRDMMTPQLSTYSKSGPYKEDIHA